MTACVFTFLGPRLSTPRVLPSNINQPTPASMPPRKRARKDEVRGVFLGLLPDGMSPTFSPADLTSDELLTAYGLANLPPDSVHARPCVKRWTENALPETLEDRQSACAKDKVAAETIVVASSNGDEYEPSKAGKTKTAKGGRRQKDLPCSPDNCSGNPFCLNWLGQDKWENQEKAMVAFRKAAGVGQDPSNDRQEGLPVGLKNLGATCYVNSFLQVWYRDLPFRAGVYACLPPASGNVDVSPLFQLQVLFTFLQTSTQAVYDPEPLVTALKLDKTEQQDSQEFSKLFLSLLDHEFKKQGSRAVSEGLDEKTMKVSTLVQDQFQGSITYGTRCKKCKTESENHSTFLELEISLAKNCTLEERIVESLKEEQMAGDNQYFCENCNHKRDATRYTILESLPPVLHFSILRFVFNMKDYTRSKSNNAITYPLRLNMGQFLPPDTNGKHVEVWYELKGVLMHKGQSAHHGHYVAQVHDASQSKWFLFDDTCVTEIDDLNAPDQYDSMETDTDKKGSASKPKLKKPAAGFTRGVNGDILPKSKDAYMLVYTLCDSSADIIPEPQPPALAQARVDELDAAHSASKKAFETQESVVRVNFEKQRDEKRSVYRTWTSGQDEGQFLLSTEALRRWIEDGLQPVKSNAGKENGTGESHHPSANGEELKGEHMNGVGGNPPGVDSETVEENLDVNMEKGDKEEPWSTNHTSSNGDTGSVEDLSTKQPWDPNVLECSRIVCRHGNANPHQADKMKVVSQAGITALQELGIRSEPQLTLQSSLCRECVWEIAADKLYEEQHANHAAIVKRYRGDESGNSVWVSKAWLLDWLKPLPRMHRAGTISDPSPEEKPVHSAEVRCQHDGLQSDQKKRELVGGEGAVILKKIFPDWTPLSGTMDVCVICDEDKAMDEAHQKEMQSIISSEKSVLLKSLDRLTQTSLHGSVFQMFDDENQHYIIPYAFASSWLLWIKGKGRRPSNIDNSTMLCTHGRLAVNVENESLKPSKIAVIGEKEWKQLHKSYDAGPQIKVWKEDDDVYKTSPMMCAECLDAERNNFSESFVKLRMLSSDDFEKDGSRKRRDDAESPELEASTTPKKQPPAKTYGYRSSKRLREQPQMKLQRQYKKLELFKGDSIKDLRIRISEKLDIPTIYQRLFFEGRELENEETAEEIGLGPQDVLELFQVVVDENVNFKSLKEGVSDSSRKRGRSEGFGGTGLFGWESLDEKSLEAAPDGEQRDNKSHAVSQTLSEPDPADVLANEAGVSCPTCTFFQVPQDECEMCGTKLTF